MWHFHGPRLRRHLRHADEGHALQLARQRTAVIRRGAVRMLHSRSALGTVALLAAILGLPAAAQKPLLPAPSATPEATPPPEVAPDSPRTALTKYFALCDKGNYQEAAGYLDLPPGKDEQGPTLARQLKAVLDRNLWVDLSKVSPHPLGNREDGLLPEFEDVGTIRSPNGRVDPVRLVRKERPDGATWLFTRTTVSKVPRWYGALEERFLLDHLPQFFLQPGPRKIPRYQWLSILVLLVPVWLGGRALGWGTRKLLGRLARATGKRWDGDFLKRGQAPLTLAWMVILAWAGTPFLALYQPGDAFMAALLEAGAIVAFFWLFLRAIAAWGRILSDSGWAKTHSAAPSLLSVGVKTGQVVIASFGIVAALSALGFNPASILAGLGIGGIAVALAATKTMENLFGSISIGIDQPLRVGDTVKVGDVVGTVERVGLRSSGIRTADRTIVTLPNGRLADMQIETFAPRDRIRLVCNLGIERGATADQIRRVLAGLEDALRSHPKTSPDGLAVSLTELREASLNIEVTATFQTTDFDEFRRIRQEMLLRFLEIVEEAGASLSVPTRKLLVANPGPTPLG